MQMPPGTPVGDTAPRTRRAWTTPSVRSLGRIGDILKGGAGKLTVVGDPGLEPGKVPGPEL